MKTIRRAATMVAALALLVCLGAVPAAADPGSLDPGFGVRGIALIDFGPGVDTAAALAIQSDGKYIVAGTHQAWESGPDGMPTRKYVTLARFNIDGTLDSTFGTGGKVMVDLSGQWRGMFADSFAFRGVADVVLLPADGRIVVASGSGGNNDHSGELAVACFKANGDLDTSFGTQGIAAIDHQPWALSMVGYGWERRLTVRPDGKLLFACTLVTAYKSDFAVSCLNPDGSLDPGFGTSGRRIIDVTGGSEDYLTFLKCAGDGRILLGGSVQYRDSAFVRLTSSGALDASFGSGGKLVIPPATPQAGWQPALDTVLTADGGFVALTGGYGVEYLCRCTSSGVIDTSFGGGHVWVNDPPSAFVNPTTRAKRVALQPDGSIVISGIKDNGYPTYKDIWVTRRLTDGSLDTGFGIDGQVVTDLGGADDVAAMGIDLDGELVVAGYALGSSPRGVTGARAPVRATAPRVGMGLARYKATASPRHRPFRIICKNVKCRKGRRATLKFRIMDNLCSKATAVKLTVKNAKGKRVKSFRWRSRKTNIWYKVKWKPTKKGTFKYSVTAKDLAGHPQVKRPWSKIVVR